MRDAIYRVIQVYGNTDPLSSGKRTILDRNILYGVIQKRFGSRRSKSRVQNDLRFHDAPLRRLTSKLPLGGGSVAAFGVVLIRLGFHHPVGHVHTLIAADILNFQRERGEANSFRARDLIGGQLLFERDMVAQLLDLMESAPWVACFSSYSLCALARSEAGCVRRGARSKGNPVRAQPTCSGGRAGLSDRDEIALDLARHDRFLRRYENIHL